MFLRRCGRSILSAILHVPFFALAFALLVPIHAYFLDQPVGARVGAIAVIFFVGSLLGGVFAWTLACLIARGLRPTSRFTCALVSFSVFVPPATAFVFYLQYQDYYSQWHHPFLTEVWFWQVGFTGAAALYIFAVAAVKYIFPLGLFLLIGAALWFTRISRNLT